MPDSVNGCVSGPTGDVVRISDARFGWPGADGFNLSIRSFSVTKGGRVLLSGPSGTGKTTLLNLLSGILVP